MSYKKEFSTHCRRCGVIWNDDLSNKYPKRAVCLPCHREEYAERKEVYKSKEYVRNQNRHDKYKPYKLSNRIELYRSINKTLKGLKTREESKEFISKRFDEMLLDLPLWDYINDTDIENKQNK